MDRAQTGADTAQSWHARCSLTGMTSKYRLLALILMFAGCSSASKQQQNKPIQISSNSPTILNARAEPGTISLNSDMQPMSPARVVADVKDFNTRVVDVRLKFDDVPLEVPMENIGGTTWRAEITPQELQMLAVSGRTVKYKTTIIAKDANGIVSNSSEPLFVAVKAPNIAHYG